MMRYGQSLESLNWVTEKLHMMKSEDSSYLSEDQLFLQKIEKGKFISKKQL